MGATKSVLVCAAAAAGAIGLGGAAMERYEQDFFTGHPESSSAHWVGSIGGHYLKDAGGLALRTAEDVCDSAANYTFVDICDGDYSRNTYSGNAVRGVLYGIPAAWLAGLAVTIVFGGMNAGVRKTGEVVNGARSAIPEDAAGRPRH